jgi:hypothetical protein
MGDADYVHGRQRARPNLSFAAELDGRVVGSNFATHWGTFGFLDRCPSTLCSGIGELPANWSNR